MGGLKFTGCHLSMFVWVQCFVLFKVNKSKSLNPLPGTGISSGVTVCLSP